MNDRQPPTRDHSTVPSASWHLDGLTLFTLHKCFLYNLHPPTNIVQLPGIAGHIETDSKVDTFDV